MTNLPKEILAIDPGKNCGWARFIDGVMTELGTLHGEEEIFPWLIKQVPSLFVVEDYKIRDERHGGFDHTFQSVFPAQVIGAIRFYACIRNIRVIMQQPQIKYAASKILFQKEYKKSNNKHHHDAFLHGMYYIKKGSK